MQNSNCADLDHGGNEDFSKSEEEEGIFKRDPQAHNDKRLLGGFKQKGGVCSSLVSDDGWRMAGNKQPDIGASDGAVTGDNITAVRV
jgi:hypothetical protein